MDYKNAHLYLYVIFFLLINKCVLAKESNYFEEFSTTEISQAKVRKDSSSSLNTITKEITYNALESGMVHFVWYSEGIENSELLSLNIDTKPLQNTLCTPMQLKQGVFKATITLPKNGQIYYGFWITKDKSGMYMDFWDWKHDQVITFTDATPITINANYSIPQKKLKSVILDYGWLILCSLLGMLGLVYLIVNKMFKFDKPVSVISKVLILGLSLFLFHVIARAEIIGLHAKTLYAYPKNVFKLFKASSDDLIYITMFVTFFLMVLVLVKKHRMLFKVAYSICIGFAFISALIAFTNITTVIYIGQPFNYEWLYYSDFLGSDDAKSALQQNLSKGIVLNLMAIGFSLFVLSNILQYLYAFIVNYKKLKYLNFTIAGLITVVFFYQIGYAETVDDQGKTDNAILAMVSSFVTSDRESSFFAMKLSDTDKTFVPYKGEKLEKVIESSNTYQIKNVLFIILESTGAEYFDLYGGQYNLNSNLNKYTNQALIFDNMYAHAPATNKSLVSILGGIYPMVSYKSLTYENPKFKHPTLSSVLKDKGYATSFFSSANLEYLSSNLFLKDRGFDVVKDYKDIDCSNQFKQNTYDDGDGIDDMCLAEQLGLWLDNVSSKNFFSVLWTVQGHYPYFYSLKEQDFGVNNFELNRYLNIIKHNDNMIGAIMEVLKNVN